MVKIIIDSLYYRDQFDDWLAGGKVVYKNDKKCYWSAQNNNYGFGWEIEPITNDNWYDISEDKFKKIITLIKRCLNEHRTEYVL